jgi:hypothetical protein
MDDPFTCDLAVWKWLGYGSDRGDRGVVVIGSFFILEFVLTGVIIAGKG